MLKRIGGAYSAWLAAPTRFSTLAASDRGENDGGTIVTADVGRPFAHRLQLRPSLTAEAVTMARALEHLKPADQRVVDDPWAKLFLSRPARRALAAWSGSLTGRVLRALGPSGTTYVPLRHRFIDDHLTAALAGGAAQVVLLGAGYDTRPYRFAEQLAGRPVFEVDLAAISRAKAAIIERHAAEFPTANVVRVEIDFEHQQLHDTLRAHGFGQGEPTFFVWEGVPMYLTRAAVKATLDAVHDLSGDGSMLAHDMWHLVDDPGPLGTARRSAPSALSLIGEPVTFGVHPEDYEHLLARHGFRVVDLAMASDLQARYAPGSAALVDSSLYVLAAERS
jgi:methyltransferase (TIGR00027 family)